MGRTQSRRRSQTWRALVVGAAVAIAAIAPTAAFAGPAPGASVYIGVKQGYGGTGLFPVWETTPVDPANPGEPDLWAYCIENRVSAKTRVIGHVGDGADFVGVNYFTDPAIRAKVAWVLEHSYPALDLASFGAAVGAAGISRNDAIEATQYAIWRYTDLNYDADWFWETPDSERAYKYLVAGANAAAPAPTSSPTPTIAAGTVSVSAPTAPQRADTLVGPFTVSTNRSEARVSVVPELPLTDADGTAIDAASVAPGQQFFVDLRGSTTAGTATVSASIPGSDATGRIVSVPTTVGATPTTVDHAQTIILVAASGAATVSSAAVTWSAAPAAPQPTLATTLVDEAGGKTLAWNGGTLVDTVTYRNLVPGTTYTVAGELMRKADGSATGITASTTFTPTAADGTVTVRFTVPSGYAGQSLVAFEWLHAGADTTGDVVAEHADIDDAAQTVAVAQQPVLPTQPTSPSPSPVTSTSPTTSASPTTSTGHTTSASPTTSASTAPAPGLAATGSSGTVGVSAAAILMMLLGGIVLLASRRASRVNTGR